MSMNSGRKFKVYSLFGERLDVSFACPADEELGNGAVQSFKDECDINIIMKKFQRTGALDWVSKYEGQYADVTGMDFQKAMDTVLRAQEMFDDLPSSVRNRFANDPVSFLEFLNDDSNREEAVKLGLVKDPQLVPAGPAVEPVK